MEMFPIDTIEGIKRRDKEGNSFPLLKEISFMNSKRPERILMNFKTENAPTYRVVEMTPDTFGYLREQVEEFYQLYKVSLFKSKE